MSQKEQYDVFVVGAKDSSPQGKEQVAKALSQSYSLPLEQARRVIAGGKFRVKRGVTLERAQRYVAHLKTLGALAVMEQSADRPASPSSTELQAIAAKAREAARAKEAVASGGVKAEPPEPAPAKPSPGASTQHPIGHREIPTPRHDAPGPQGPMPEGGDEGISIMHFIEGAAPASEGGSLTPQVTPQQRSAAPPPPAGSFAHQAAPPQQLHPGEAHAAASPVSPTLPGEAGAVSVEHKGGLLSVSLGALDGEPGPKKSFLPASFYAPEEAGGPTPLEAAGGPTPLDDRAFAPPDEPVVLETAAARTPDGGAPSVQPQAPSPREDAFIPPDENEPPLELAVDRPSPSSAAPPPGIQGVPASTAGVSFALNEAPPPAGALLEPKRPSRSGPVRVDSETGRQPSAERPAVKRTTSSVPTAAQTEKPGFWGPVGPGLLSGRLRENLAARVLLGVFFSVLLAFVPASLYASRVHATTIRALQEEERELHERPQAAARGRTPSMVREEIGAARRQAFVVTLGIWVALSVVLGFFWFRYV